MMSKTFDCAECGASAPYGRLSCPSCGALLASVTGALKPALRAADVEAQPDRQNESEPIAATGSVAVAEAPGTSASNGKTRRRAASPAAVAIHRPEAPRATAAPAAAPVPARAATVPVSAPKPAQTAFGRWRDADPSRCSAGHGARRDTRRAGPGGPPSTDGAGIAPGSHPDGRPKPGRTAHAPLRADAGGGRPSARCGRRRAGLGRRRAHHPTRSSSPPWPPPSSRPRAHARPDGKGADPRSCRAESERGAASRDRASARALGDRRAAGDAVGAARRACPGARRTPVSAPSARRKPFR